MSLFALLGFKFHRTSQNEILRKFGNFLLILFGVTFVLFSFCTTKLPHYTGLGWYPISFFAAFGFYELLRLKQPLPKWFYSIYLLVIAAGSIVFVGLMHSNILNDTMTSAESFGQALSILHWGPMTNAWEGWESSGGILFGAGAFVCFLLFVRKKYAAGAFGLLIVGLLISIFIYSVLYPKRLRQIQADYLRFCENHAGQDLSVDMIDIRSFLPIFYLKAGSVLDDRTTKEEQVKQFLALDPKKTAYLLIKPQWMKSLEEKFPDLKQRRVEEEYQRFVVYKK
jgi:hypothetical protein